jgi:chromosome partitioning protein
LTQIITITNQKGGVGKTTTASALMCGLHQRGARVLGIDLDPQGNLGFTLGLDIGANRTVYDVFTGACSMEQAIVSTEYGDVLPSDIMLSAAETEFRAPRREFMLSRQIDTIRDKYDFIVIDTPPSLNVLTINAYVASTGLIIPMEPEVLSLVGVSQIQDTINVVQKSFNPQLKVLCILLNKFNPRLNLSQDILELAEQVAAQLHTRVFPTKVRRGVAVAMAPAHGQSVISYRPDSKPALDLMDLVDFVAGNQFPAVKESRWQLPFSGSKSSKGGKRVAKK